MINWEEDGLLPSRIWGFVNLCDLLSNGYAVDFGGIDRIYPGSYAIIESSKIVKGKRGEVYSEISYVVELEVEKLLIKGLLNSGFIWHMLTVFTNHWW
jgi:hypothetical protein